MPVYVSFVHIQCAHIRYVKIRIYLCTEISHCIIESGTRGGIDDDRRAITSSVISHLSMLRRKILERNSITTTKTLRDK